MKKISMILILAALMTVQLLAQPGQGIRRGDGIPGMRSGNAPGALMCEKLDLTIEQQKQMKALKLKLEKEMIPLRADKMKSRGELRLLKAEEKSNLKAINNKIDEITSLNAKMMKARARHHVAVKSILTEEQRLKWEQFQMHKKGKRGHKGYGRCGGGCSQRNR